MSDDTMVTQTCEQCGFPILVPLNSPCPYCHGTSEWSVEQLQVVLYDLPLTQLLRLKVALQSPDREAISAVAAPISARLDSWIGSETGPFRLTLATVVDVLLTLYAISEEPAPPAELKDVITSVADGHLDQLPLPPRGPCFCASGRRYKKCHGRSD